jgi:hypothetical protein
MDKDMAKCLKKFLFFSWKSHEWEQTDIKEDRKTIGKKFDEFEVGIYKVVITTTEEYTCKYCGLVKTESSVVTETRRQYH